MTRSTPDTSTGVREPWLDTPFVSCALCENTENLHPDPHAEGVWYCIDCLEAFENTIGEHELAEGD